MLKIKQLNSYRVPRYPAGRFEPWKQPAGVTLVKRSAAASAALLALLELCEPVGALGPLPSTPQFLTENEARSTIDKVFARNAIQLTADVPFDLVIPADVPFLGMDTVQIKLDGFNDSLRVGYECISGEDMSSFGFDVTDRIDPVTCCAGARIMLTGVGTDTAYLVQFTQDFIDTLKAHGVI